MLKQLGSGAIF